MLNRLLSENKLLIAHWILLIPLVILLSIKELPPHPVSVSDHLNAGEPLTIVFNKPVVAEGVSEKIKVFDEAGSVVGTTTANETTITFSPERPWKSAGQYRFQLDPLPGKKQDKSFTQPIDQTFSIRTERLFFLTSDKRLSATDLSTGNRENITPEDLSVLSFSLATGNRFVALYEPKNDHSSNGIILGKWSEGKYRLSISTPVNIPKYSLAELCNGGQTLITINYPKIGKPIIQYSTVDWDDSPQIQEINNWNLRDTRVYGKGDIICSADTARVLYRKSSDAFVSNFIGEDSESLFGVFDSPVAIAPEDQRIVLQKTITTNDTDATFRQETTFFNQDGESQLFQEEMNYFIEGKFNGNGSTFSSLLIDGEKFLSRILLRERSSDGWWKPVEELRFSTNERVTHHALSRDGLFLVAQVEQVSADGSAPAGPSEIRAWDRKDKRWLVQTWFGENPQWTQ